VSSIPPGFAAQHRYSITKILNDRRMTARSRKLALWNYILNAEITMGSQFLVTKPDGSLYITLGATNQTLSLPTGGRGGEKWFAYFNQMYGFTEREDQSKWLYDALRHYVLQQGARVELRRFSAYDLANKTVYLSAYNGQMYRLDGGDVQTVGAGEDGIFFADDDGGQPCDVDVGPHGLLFDRLTNLNFADSGLSGISPEQQRKALIIWMFALAFPDLMPTKPLVLLEGTQGSGKSATCQLIQIALMGASSPMILSKNKEDDFGVLLLRSPIAVFDNTDSYIEWVPDAICAYTTAGLWKKRKLYANDEEHIIRPHAFIAIASKNPASFRREDVADRCIILRLERRKIFVRFQKLQQEVLDQRGQIFGEYLWYVNRIVEELRLYGDQEAEGETHRMADFAALGRVVARVMDWPQSEIDGLMLALQGERDAFINEEDPLVDLLHKWIAYRQKNGPSNIGRWINPMQLLPELETLAQAYTVPFKHSARSLAQKLRSPHIEREFHVETTILAGHKTYRFYRHTDPRLEVVMGGDTSDDEELLEAP